MPFIPEETIEEIRQRADIVSVVETYVQLKKRNQEFWACCPFHQEKTPSFKLSPAHQTYHCFGCGAGGNVFRFIMNQENVDFIGAVHLLAQRFNVMIPEAGGGPGSNERKKANERAKQKETLVSCLRDIAAWYHQLLAHDEGKAAREYLQQRGLDQAAIERFGIGFAPDSWDRALEWGERHNYPKSTMLDCGLLIEKETKGGNRVYDRFRNRIMFPIRDELGRVVGFSGRTMEADAKAAKYINTPDTSLFHKGKLLYGLDLARTNFKPHGFALVCEGQLDVIACHRCGFDNAIAPQGTAFTEDQARVLKRFTSAVTFAFDSDSAGLQAAAKSIKIAFRMELKPRVVSMPEGEDPDSLFQARGEEGLSATLNKSEEALEFLFRFACRNHDLQSAHGKDEIAWFLLDIFSVHPSAILRSAYCQWLSARLKVPENAVFEMLNQHLRKTRNSRSGSASPDLPDSATSARPVQNNREPASRVEAAVVTLLDLALHHGSLAQQLTTRLNREFLGHNPPAKALNLVLDAAENGAHAEAGQSLAAAHELSGDPRISRVLAGSDYPQLPAETEAAQQRTKIERKLQQALEDCLSVIEFNSLERVLQQLDQEIETEKDPERQREKLLEYQKLVHRSRQLSKQPHE